MFIAGANNYKEDDGVFHVWAHGELDVIHVYDKSKGENIPIRTREKFNTFMNENSEEWRNRDRNEPAIVILHSCETGKETPNNMLPIASKISKALGNAIVIAPTEKVVVDGSTQKEVGTYSTKTVRDGRVTKTVKDRQGTWSECANGEKTDSYPGNQLPSENMTKSFMDRIRDYMLNLFNNNN